MRIANILYEYAGAGARVVDLTPDGVAERVRGELPPEFLGEIRRHAASGDRDAVVLQALGETLSWDVEGTVVVVFAERIDAFFGAGLVTEAASRGLEVVDVHVTERPELRHAAVLRRSERGAELLRVVNEYRIVRPMLRRLDEETDRARESAHKARVMKERAENELAGTARALAELRDERAPRAAELERLRGASAKLDRTLAERDAYRKRAEQLEAELERVHHRLRRSRESVTFRVGRATTVALRAARKKPWTLPKSWVDTFRGKDPLVDELDPSRLRAPAPKVDAGEDDLEAVERRHFLLGMGPRGAAASVAGVVGHRLARQLARNGSFRLLTPNAWRHLLEVESPAFVLVTRDGMAPGTAWGDFGSPQGRDGTAELTALTQWCARRGLPVVWWDTLGVPALRHGAPRGPRFDAVFTVSPRLAAEGEGRRVEPLLPALEPYLHAPLGGAGEPPRGVVFAGRFDRRLPRRQLASLGAILDASKGRGLRILDEAWGYQGVGAAAVRLPEALQPYARPRPGHEAEAWSIRDAGISVTVHDADDADFPSWQALRSLALGAQVISTPGAFVDDALTPRIAQVASEVEAETALTAAFERPPMFVEHELLDRLASEYGLASRLSTMAERLGTAEVATPRAVLDLLAFPRSNEELAALGGWLKRQQLLPRRLRLVVADGVDVDRLASPVPVSRLRRLAGAMPTLRAEGATHVVPWGAGVSARRDGLQQLSRAIRWSDAPVVALDAAATSARMTYSQQEDVDLAAVRVESLAGRLPDDLSAVVERLVDAGMPQLVLHSPEEM